MLRLALFFIAALGATSAEATDISWTRKADAPVAAPVNGYGVLGSLLCLFFDTGPTTNRPLHCYDGNTNSWTTTAGIPSNTAVYLGGAATIGSKFYAVPGINLYGLNVLVFDLATNTWTIGAPRPVENPYPAVAAVNGKVYVLGGTQPPSARLDSYDPSTNLWNSALSPAPYPAGLAATAVIGNVMYILGGRDGDPNGAYGELRVQAYDTTTDTWSIKASMPYTHVGGAADVVGGKIYIVGTGDGSYDRVDEYDPVNDEWLDFPYQPPTPTQVGHYVAAAGTINNKLYVAAGVAGRDSNFNPVYTAAVEEGTPNGPPRLDQDGDGVPDDTDACPNTSSGMAVDSAGCSCTQKSCADSNACTYDSCDDSTAQCSHSTACLNGQLDAPCGEQCDPTASPSGCPAGLTCSNSCVCQGGSDSSPPVRFGMSPTGVLQPGSTSATLSLRTDEAALCKYASQAGSSYLSMSRMFAGTGDTFHTQPVSGLTPGATYTYYVRCEDRSGNPNLDDAVISFAIPSTPDNAPPIRSYGIPSGTLPAGSTAGRLQLTTNENAVCRYSTVANTPYSMMPAGFTNTGGISHSIDLNTLADGQNYRYYVRCRDANGNTNSDDFMIAFAVATPQALADLIIDGISVSPSTAGPGSRVTIGWRIRNQGSGTAAASKARVRLSSDSTLTTSDLQLGGDRGTLALAAGAVQDFTLTATLPTSLSVGVMYVGVTADVLNAAQQSDFDNDQALTAITISDSQLVISKRGAGSGIVTTDIGGISCGSECQRFVAPGSRLTMSASADAGSIFIGWDVSRCKPRKPCSVTVRGETVVRATFVPIPPPGPKSIYFGICGNGGLLDVQDCIPGKGWYDPSSEDLFAQYNPLNDGDMNEAANLNSGLDAIGLRLRAFQPTNSMALVFGFTNASVVPTLQIMEALKVLYSPGDRLYLAGHSRGGGLVQDVAKKAKAKGIPVEVTAQFDSVGFDAAILPNVKRAFNFYHPGSYFACPIVGESNIVARDASRTVVSNVAIMNPAGPDGATGCGPHRNMDNDPRVWRPVIDYILSALGF